MALKQITDLYEALTQGGAMGPNTIHEDVFHDLIEDGCGRIYKSADCQKSRQIEALIVATVEFSILLLVQRGSLPESALNVRVGLEAHEYGYEVGAVDPSSVN